MAIRIALFTDIIDMAAATLRANKLRASLTILGVVIGITAMVGIISLNLDDGRTSQFLSI